jgi:hypothetical protein
MRPMVAGLVGLVPGVALAAVFAPRLGVALVVGAILAGAIWMMSRCRHPGRLGLLPPSALADGTRLPARWFCDACGKSWPAAFEHENTPVVRYSGFDETKAPAAARRAADLDRRKQALAVKRAGLAESSARARESAREMREPARPTIVAIEGRRIERQHHLSSDPALTRADERPA